MAHGWANAKTREKHRKNEQKIFHLLARPALDYSIPLGKKNLKYIYDVMAAGATVYAIFASGNSSLKWKRRTERKQEQKQTQTRIVPRNVVI